MSPAVVYAGLLLLASAPAHTQAPPVPAAPAGELRFTILHTSDEHSALLPVPASESLGGAAGPSEGGFARLATVVEAVRARTSASDEPVLLTSAGDNIGGSPFAWLGLDGEAPELSLMVELGYDVLTLGNHEFDYGSDRLAVYLAAAGFPSPRGRTALVATNTRWPEGHPLGSRGIRRTHHLELANGLRIGFLGLLGEGAARFTPLAPPVDFVDAHAAAAAAVAELRAAGVDLVVAITHAGLREDRALARAVPGIDLILGGHDHRLLDAPILEAGTLIVHPGAHLAQVFQLELAFERSNRELRLRNPQTGSPYVLPLDASVPEAPWMAARVEAYARMLEARIGELAGSDGPRRLGETIARSREPLPARPALSETPLGNFVTDAMRHAVEESTGQAVDFAFEASGLIRTDLRPGTREGYREDLVLYDFLGAVGMGSGPDGRPGYPLVSLWLTGGEVRRVLEVSILLSNLMGNSYYLQVSGLRATYDPRRAVLLRLPVRGTPVPTGRAVLDAARQTDAGELPLERGDTTLFHVVTDHYVASFLPMVGRLAPRFSVVPKDAAGDPLPDLDTAIVRRGGEELKVWQAVVEFAAAQPLAADGLPRIPLGYTAPEGRLLQVRAVPLWLWPALVVTMLLLLLGAAASRLRRRRGAGGAAPAGNTQEAGGRAARRPLEGVS